MGWRGGWGSGVCESYSKKGSLSTHHYLHGLALDCATTLSAVHVALEHRHNLLVYCILDGTQPRIHHYLLHILHNGVKLGNQVLETNPAAGPLTIIPLNYFTQKLSIVPRKF